MLFHTGNHHNVVGQQHHNSQICIQLTASLLQENNEERSQICSLKESGKEGTCLGQLTLPSSWWPSFTPKDLVKQPKIRINVKYSVFETPMGCEESKFFLNFEKKEAVVKRPFICSVHMCENPLERS